MDFQSKKSFGKLRLRAFQPYHQILCILKHVGDVGDRSSTPKGFNAMYVEDVEDRSNTPKGCNAMYVKEDGKEHTDTFWLITSLILNGFSIRKKFWKAET